MEQTMPFCLDHFSIITDKRRQASELLKGLGFVTSDTHKNGSTHFIFDNTYCEVFYTERGGQLKWLTNTIPAGAMPRVGSYRLSVGGQDAGRVREALLSGNVEGVGRSTPYSASLYGTVRYQEKPVTRLFSSSGSSPLLTFFLVLQHI